MSEAKTQPEYRHNRLLDQVRYYFNEKPHVFPNKNGGRLEYDFIYAILAGKNPFEDEELVRLPVLLSEWTYSISEVPNDLKQKIWNSYRSLSDIFDIFQYGFLPNAKDENVWFAGCTVMISPKGILKLKDSNLEINLHDQIYNFAIWGQCQYNEEEYKQHYAFVHRFSRKKLTNMNRWDFQQEIQKAIKKFIKKIEIVSRDPLQYLS